MAPTRQHTAAVAKFRCLGSECPDTCCKGWGMQLTKETVALYETKAPQLLSAVDSGEAEFIMKRDASTDYCVKFDAGLCAIHRDYGEEFLGDACHFYPRITRALGDTVVTTAAISCPEAARLMVAEEGGYDLMPRAEIRVPYSLRNYLPAELDADAAMAIHQAFVRELGNETFSPERNFMRASVVARALETQKKEAWPAATEFYFKMADGRIPPAEAVVSDPHNLLNALQGLIAASKATARPALMRVVEDMAKSLGVTLDWSSNAMAISPDAPSRITRMLYYWKEHKSSAEPMLRRYLQAQCSQALFPFAGLGHTVSDRVTVLGVRFATVKLALMSEVLQKKLPPSADEVVRIVYSLSRFIDHLADPELSMAIYKETGWVREARLRALVGDE